MTSTDADKIPGEIIEDRIIEPSGHCAREVREGEVFRIVDIEGQQVMDFLAFNLNDLDERLSPENTLNLNKQIYPKVGYTLFSDKAGKLMTIVADTCGIHDMLAGACSRYTNEYRYDVPGTANCRDNFVAALEPWGLAWKDIPYNMNVFMNCPIQADGTFSIEVPKSKAGDYIDFRADMDVLVAGSNCPQVLNPCNSGNLKPLRVVHYRPG